jgi:predicted nucleic acid-binding protein
VLVVDASAFVAFLDPAGDAAAVDAYLAGDAHWVVPEHFMIEVTHALRGLWLRGAIDEPELDAALAALGSAHLDVWPTLPLLPRVRELMPNVSAYDAAYVALAEELASPLLTVNAGLTRVPGARCAFVV